MAGTVLIVEDNVMLRKLYQAALKDLGLMLIETGSGEEAIEAAAHEHPDLAIMDVNLPGIPGTEAARRLRVIPGLEDLPVVAVTTAAELLSSEVIEQAGFDDVLTKPVSIGAFQDTVRDHLERAAA